MAVNKLSQIVKLNGNFKNSINLYLNLNKKEKIESYIPTKSSLNILKRYANSVKQNKNHSTILIGSYGKGKSHLLLILLAIVSMERSKENDSIVSGFLKKIQPVDVDAYKIVRDVWQNKGRFLPVIISGSQDDVSRSFMIALNDALKREKLTDLMPDTFFSIAKETVARWKAEYPAVYENYEKALKVKGTSAKIIENGLKVCNPEILELFKKIYPSLMGGEQFNPLAGSEVLPMYQSVANKLHEERGYSGIYIVFDEFSKFIEGQEKHAIGGNMKFLQDMCELANESKEMQIYMTMVAHKSIKEYGTYLPEAIINAFTGIEGRIEEVIFNTSSKNCYELIQNAIETDTERLAEIPDSNKFFGREKIDEYYKIPAFRTTFTNKDFEKIIIKGCYPLSPVSAYALLNISEKVAQNERTLFTFISKEEPNSMAQLVSDHSFSDEWIITPDRVYDYFQNMFKKEKANERVHTEWLNAEYAISKAKEASKIRMLKTLAVLNIINKFDEMPPTEEILKIASGLPNATEILSALVAKELLYKKDTNNCYVFKTRAGATLKSEIKKRKALKDVPNLPKAFAQISDIQYVLPKKYNNQYSMTRYFRYEYLDVKDFLQIDNINVFLKDGKFQDGKVIALYSLENADKTKEIQKKVKTFGAENIVVIYTKTPFVLINKVTEYEILQDIRTDVKFMKENEILSKELNVMEEDIVKLLSNFLEDEFENADSHVTFYHDGQGWVLDENITTSAAVDAVCTHFYSETMVINNELINKQYIKTAPIKKSRKIIMENIMNKCSDEDYLTGTSAESTIYRAVMVNSGILAKEKPDKVQNLLEMFDEFFDECVEEKQSLSILINKYSAKPYGMRAGVLPILLAYVLSQKKEDIIVYYEDRETTLTVDAIINMVDYPEKYSMFISKDSADKDKYLQDLSKLFADKADNNLSGNRIENILTCMQRWYRALPQITKNIRKENEYISDKQVLKALPKLKNIMQRMDVNAYEAIFETLPEICGDTDYEETISFLQVMKVKLNGYMDWLFAKVAEDTRKIFSEDGKDDLIHTLKTWYENQSDVAKHGLYNAAVSGFMSCIADIDTYDEYSVVSKIMKIITEVHADSWNDDSYTEYIEKLNDLKAEIESIGSEDKKGNYVLTFTGKNGEIIQKYYDPVDMDEGAMFRNIIEDQLESFADLDVNVRVAILLEMIEKVMRKED
ncbi:hypothetical protein MUB35_19840 [Blautia sp. NSJ-175]|uniref:hypothetical protein n=1 Tax=Blautia sp. NSJ-175 TaxID=2931396 RepID=UPI001FCFF6E6|nr:hypothetical protein [Blautia sp. NSJ-175]MCJ7847578.1 hypothetical protein [Blautia sp. NSJ-175]